jgi:hypothetical protein
MSFSQKLQLTEYTSTPNDPASTSAKFTSAAMPRAKLGPLYYNLPFQMPDRETDMYNISVPNCLTAYSAGLFLSQTIQSDDQETGLCNHRTSIIQSIQGTDNRLTWAAPRLDRHQHELKRVNSLPGHQSLPRRQFHKRSPQTSSSTLCYPLLAR